MKNRTVFKNAKILTLNEKDELFEKADLVIEGDTIISVGNPVVPEMNDQVIDCSNKLICPGFVNAHLHSDENMFKGMYDNMPLELWMLYSYPPSAEYGPFSDRFVYLRTILGAIEQIRSGVTSCQDDVSGHPLTTLETHNIIFKAYLDIGMRANVSTSELHKNYLDTIPYLRELMPQELQKKFGDPRSLEEALNGAEEIIQHWNGVQNLKVVLSPIAPQRCDDEFNIKIFELAEKYDLPYHTHICETRTQRETGFLFYGDTILRHCQKLGILSPRTTIAHGNWMDDEDIKIIGETGATVVHNIVSNLKLGSGIMPWRKMKDNGVNIALGTDGMSSNDSQSILDVMKTAALIHKVTQPDFRKWPDSGEILEAATRGGARSLMREKEIGSLEAGKQADLLFFDLNSTAFTPCNNVKNQIVYCENGSSLQDVMAAGKYIMKDKEILTVNEKELMDELREMTEDFMKHYRKTLHLSDQVFPYVEQAYWKCIHDPDTLWRFSASKEEYGNLPEK